MDKEKVIALLNQDLEGEHGAIIQYLSHAYAMGEGEMACEIEALAREEMRHLDWLAETIVELGGVPSLKRGRMLAGGTAVADWMTNPAGTRLRSPLLTRYMGSPVLWATSSGDTGPELMARNILMPDSVSVPSVLIQAISPSQLLELLLT